MDACGASSKSAEECQKICEETIGCVQFVWATKHEKCCRKNTINNNPGKLSDHIIGPKSCKRPGMLLHLH